MPGDCIQAADGQYAGVTIAAKGTATAPIVVEAVNQLKASFTSGVKFNAAAWVVVQGFAFGGGGPGVTVTDSSNCRVTRSQIQMTSGTWVTINGMSDATRIDHCDIGGATTTSDIVNPTGLSTNTLIDHNHFHDLSATHTVTLGCCGPTYDYHDTGDVAEFNLFENCNSGSELFSIKSSSSTVRYNTVRNVQGDIDIRSGKNNAIYGNYVFNGTQGSGIRMYEDNHKVYDNYVASGRTLAVGPSDPIHAQVQNATIVFNTFVGPVDFGDDLNTNFSNNIVLGNATSKSGSKGSAPVTPTYQGNILFMGSGPSTGFTKVDPMLVQMGDLLTITATSPAVGAAMGSFPFVIDDVQGKPRGAKPDTGAEQWSTSSVTRPVLTSADVGPSAP